MSEQVTPVSVSTNGLHGAPGVAARALAATNLEEIREQASRRRRDYRLRRMLAGADVLALICGMVTWLVISRVDADQRLLWGLLTLPVWLGLFNVYGLYASGLRKVGYSTVDDIPAMAHALLVGSVGLWLYFQITPAGKIVFGELLTFAAVVFVFGLAFRTAVRKVALQLLGTERVMFVGSGPMTPILVRQMLRQARHGLEPVGVVTQAENEQWPLPLADLGSLDEVNPASLLRAYSIDRVIVSAEGMEDERVLDLICTCREHAIKISTLPSLSAVMGPGAMIDHLEGITLIGLNTPTLARSSRMLKRAMDILGAGFLLLITAPVWVVAAIAIKLDSPGPVLFRQNRIGRGGKPFRLTKFRSMVIDAEAQRAALLAQSRQQKWLDLERDPRITRVGRFLRLSSLDELPQLWNVLRGDMSLVGPRPLIEEEDRNVSGWARGRLGLTPGITGVWQVFGRAAIPFEQMIMLDYLYVANWSLWTDVKLMLRTVPVVLTRRGAN
jgi:exopolysaccharide biosynthesis polyprenyl glycosylphosphotransferase